MENIETKTAPVETQTTPEEMAAMQQRRLFEQHRRGEISYEDYMARAEEIDQVIAPTRHEHKKIRTAMARVGFVGRGH